MQRVAGYLYEAIVGAKGSLKFPHIHYQVNNMKEASKYIN